MGRMDDQRETSGAVPVRDDHGVVPVDLRDWVDFDDDEARCIRVLVTDRIALDVWCVQPRQSTPVLDFAEQDVTYTVLGGRSWFVTDEGEIGLDPLGAMLVPAGTAHGIDNRAPDPLIVLAASSPPSSAPRDEPAAEIGEAVRLEPEGPGLLRRAWAAMFGPSADQDVPGTNR